MGFLQRVVRNDAMRVDPPEIYSWRVLMLACSVCHLYPKVEECASMLMLISLGMLWGHVVWYGHWHHRWCYHVARIQGVSLISMTIQKTEDDGSMQDFWHIERP